MEKFRKYLRIALPALFIAYLGCLIAFTHVHIVNGVTIVHSHPYHKTDDGRPDHEHGYAEFQLLHQLSTIQISGAAFVSLLLAAFLTVLFRYPAIRSTRIIWSPYKGNRLFAPLL